MKPILQIRHLSFNFAEVPLLQGINLEIACGQLLHIKGANGSGKTTLLKLIAGLLLPTKGKIHFENKCIQEDPITYKRHLCYVGHKSGINAALSPRENSLFDLHYGRRSFDWELGMQKLSLSHYQDTPCGELSAGQKRRVALLRLLMSDAKLWLLDEPFVALDGIAQLFLMEEINRHLEEGGCVILTSHQPLPMNALNFLEYSL